MSRSKTKFSVTICGFHCYIITILKISVDILNCFFKCILFHLLVEVISFVFQAFYLLFLFLVILFYLCDIVSEFVDEFQEFIDGSFFLSELVNELVFFNHKLSFLIDELIL